MILYVNGSERLPVFDCDTGKFYGRITEILLDDGFKEVLGYVCRTRIFRPRWAFEPSAVRLINEDLMLIDRKGKKWLPLNATIRDAWRRSKQLRKIGVKEGDKSVGEVADFAFEAETGRVIGFLLSRGLFGKLVFIPWSNVEMSGRDCIVIKKGSSDAPPMPKGGLLGGFLKSAAKSLGAGAALARKAALDRAAASLAGKPAPSDVLGVNGEVLVGEGEIMTPEIIDKLKKEDKLSEAYLLMSGKRFGRGLAGAKKSLKSTK